MQGQPGSTGSFHRISNWIFTWFFRILSQKILSLNTLTLKNSQLLPYFDKVWSYEASYEITCASHTNSWRRLKVSQGYAELTLARRRVLEAELSAAADGLVLSWCFGWWLPLALPRDRKWSNEVCCDNLSGGHTFSRSRKSIRSHRWLDVKQ